MSNPPQANPVVLVVEDEVLVRTCVVDQLADAGFDVISAAEAEEALFAFQNHAGVTTLFTDISMPGRFDGLALAHKIFELRPTVQLILTSGHGEPKKCDMPAGVRFLPKPYDSGSLASLIKAA